MRLFQNSLKFNLRGISKQEREIGFLEINRMPSKVFAFDSCLGMLLSFYEFYKYSWGIYLIRDERDIISLETGGSKVADGPFSRLSIL